MVLKAVKSVINMSDELVGHIGDSENFKIHISDSGYLHMVHKLTGLAIHVSKEEAIDLEELFKEGIKHISRRDMYRCRLCGKPFDRVDQRMQHEEMAHLGDE